MTVSQFIRKTKIHLIVLIIAILVGGVTSYRLGQDVNWDLLNYHYYDGYALIHNRINTDIAPAQFESYDNPLPSVPAYVLISHFSPKTTGVILGAIQGLNIWIIFEIALIFLRRVKMKELTKIGLALFIGILSFFGAASISEVGNSMGDNLTSIPTLLGLLLLLYSFQKPKVRISPRWIRLLAYFLVGIAVGLKLTEAVYAIPLFLAGLVVEGAWRQKIKESVFHGLSIVVGVLVSSGFWFVVLWDKFKNPVFPYYNAVFKSQYYPPINFVDKRWFHPGIGHVLFYPFYFINLQVLSSEEPFKDPRLAVVYVLLMITAVVAVVAKLFWKKNIFAKLSKEHVAFWVFFILSYVLWEKEFSYYRYLLPLELLSLVAIATLVYVLVKNVLLASSIIVISIVLITIFTTPINWGRIPWQSTYFGVTSSEFKVLDNSTVLVAGYDPFSFLVPYFPASSTTIRVESDLTSPMAGTVAEQNVIKSAILRDEKKGTPFFSLQSDEEQAIEEKAFNAFGFKTGTCKKIFVNVRQNSSAKIRLCTLDKVQH